MVLPPPWRDADQYGSDRRADSDSIGHQVTIHLKSKFDGILRRAWILCFSQKLDLGASASVAKSLFHWLRGRFMMLKRMLRIQIL